MKTSTLRHRSMIGRQFQSTQDRQNQEGPAAPARGLGAGQTVMGEARRTQDAAIDDIWPRRPCTRR